MSISTSAFGLTAHQHRRSCCKAIPNHVFGSAAVACLVLGCAWTLHANVFGASVYPQLSSANFDAPVVKRSVLAVRSTPSVADTIVAALPEPTPVISAPASIPSRPWLSFDDRLRIRRCQRDREHWTEPKPRAGRHTATLRSLDRRLRYLRAHGLPARRRQAGSAFRSRLQARRSQIRPRQDAGRDAAAYL